MKIIIDADACPVINETIAIADTHNLDVILVSDFNHELHYEGVTCICVAQGNDASDHKIFELCEKDDIVITSDGGLANLILGKRGVPISFNGVEYHLGNIDQILMERYLNAKERATTKRFKHIPKRTRENDETFKNTLTYVIKRTH